VPQKQPTKGRLRLNDGSCIRLRPEHPNHVWFYDFVEDRTHDGRKFRLLNAVDELTHECLAIRVARKLKATDVIDVLSDLFILRRVPGHIRSDNGPEFIAQAVQDWIRAVGAKTATIEPGSPWENGYIESFNARLRGELLDGEIFPKAEPIRSPVPMRRFRYDAKHDFLECPRSKVLKPGRSVKHGRFFTSRARDSRHCDLASLCLSKGRVNKAVVLGHDYPALLRARRRGERWREKDQRLYQRHRWRVEGYHGEAKTWNGPARAVRRGLQNMRIQAYLTAAAMNLKRLAAYMGALLRALAAALLKSIATAWPSRLQVPVLASV
jgi:transposase InsO family protein